MTTSRIPDPAGPFEEEGLPATDSELPGKLITGDAQDGMVPPRDRPIGTDSYGVTATEQARGEMIDTYVAAEEPDVLSALDDEPDESMTADQPFPVDYDERAGRIVDTDHGIGPDEEADVVGEDVGTDTGGFTAEERAMHVEPGA